MIDDIDRLTTEEYERMPLVIRGASKEVRYAGAWGGGHHTVVRYLPTVHSFTAGRAEVVEGSDGPRLRAMAALLPVLRAAGVDHAYEQVGQRFALSRLVLPHPMESRRYGCGAPDLPAIPPGELAAVPRAAPIEVIVKAFHSGTSKHGYVGMGESPVRASHPLFAGFAVRPEAPYPRRVVRFDWRNPVEHEGRRMDDRALPEGTADLYVDVAEAGATALRVYDVLRDFFAARDVVVYDLCLFIAEDGRTVFGEIGPDCGRFRHYHMGSLDKDVFRAGGGHRDVVEKWSALADLCEAPRAPRPLPRRAPGRFVLGVGTSNPHKVREIGSILALSGVELQPVSLPEAPEETGATLMENAILKARAYAAASGLVTMAEDSGLFVDVLNGLPGVHSARFSDCEIDTKRRAVVSHHPSGRPRPAIDAANNALVLALLDGVPAHRRGAYFEVAFAVAAPDGTVLYRGSAASGGWIAAEARGSEGFGYDPIFVGQDTGDLTWAELDAARKDLRSHREEALRGLAVWLGDALADGAPLPSSVRAPAGSLAWKSWQAGSVNRYQIGVERPKVVVVDGNDGLGKTTLVAALRARGFDAVDRGAPTKRTDDPGVRAVPGELYVVLDAPVGVSRARLAAAGKNLDERYHTEADLARYRPRFLAAAEALGGFVVDADAPEAEVLARVLALLASQGVTPTRAPGVG